MHYYVNEAAFGLPERPWVDRTLHRLSAPSEGEEDAIAVEIRRIPMKHEESLRALVDGAVEAEVAKQNGFSVASRAEALLDGAPALLVRGRSREGDSVRLRFEAHVALEGMWLAFVVTGPSSRRAVCEETFDRLVAGLRWRRA